MADNIYTINELATGVATVTVDDDGSGDDWLILTGDTFGASDIRLTWFSTSGTSTSASGLYFSDPTHGHRLVVNGLIENVRGSNGRDAIQGNEVGNFLYGDGTIAGIGDSDTITGGDGNDLVYGGAAADSLSGDDGDDRVFGGLGRDTISGGAGADLIGGGAGADILAGGADRGDAVTYLTSTAGVRVNITYGSATTGHGGDAEGDQIGGFDQVLGSTHDDVIRDTNATTLAFDYNDNNFFAEAGNDRLYLGGGDDLGDGGKGADLIEGGLGDDTLVGFLGKDTLFGGTGHDSLKGGIGADVFVFTRLTDSTLAVGGRDVMTDFHHGQHDRIDLTAIDADADAEGIQGFHHIDGTRFDGSNGALIVRAAGTNTLVLADIDGDRHADFAIEFLGVYQYRESDWDFASR